MHRVLSVFRSPRWSPYAVGILIGVLSWITFAFMGKALGTSTSMVTIAGTINEALDIWARDVLLPPVREGDYIAFINAGGYASAMSSNHCRRGEFTERLLFPRDLPRD